MSPRITIICGLPYYHGNFVVMEKETELYSSANEAM